MFFMKKNLQKVLFFPFMMLSILAFGQKINVKGKITSSDDGQAVPGVSVSVKGTSIGTTSNAEGFYAISVENGATLTFSFIGMESQTIKLNGQTILNVVMNSATSSLDEVVVTALGITQEKKALGYAVQELKAESIKNSGEPNVINAMQGKIAGAIITSSGGAPGGGTNIILRGITSLSSGSSNQPLFVVDGIIISNNTVAGNPLPSAGSNSPGASEQFSNTNRGADINPDDIESLSVLKGPAATALYGLRASNGAIIITTKRAKSGKLGVSISSSIGLDQLGKSPYIQDRFIQGRNGEFIAENDPTTRSIFRSFGPLVEGSNDKVYDNFRTFYQNGLRNNNNITLTKGTDKYSVYFSLGRNYQKGIVPFSDFSRNSAKAAVNYNVTSKFKVGTTLNYVNSGGNRPPSGDKSIYSSLSYWPNSYDVNDYIKADGSQNNITLGVVDNPKYLMAKSARVDNNNRFIGDINLSYDLTSWLTAKYQVTLDTYKETRSRQVDSTFDVGTQVKGFLVNEYLNFREVNSNLYLTAQKTFNEDFSGSFMLGNSIVDSQSPDSYFERGEGWKAPFDKNISSYRNVTNRPYSPEHYRIVSVFADAKLNYRDMIYLNLTGRNDKVSTLPVQNNSFFYPSANLGFIFTELLPKTNFLTFGKIRASWAQVGKGTSPYVTGSYYNVVDNFPYGGTVPGYNRVSTTADPNLKPERTTSKEIGSELRLLKNRIMIDATYYTMDSKDQIVNAPVSNGSGYSRYFTNIGLIRNKGVELLITGKIIKNKKFGWEASLNWSKQRGTVIEMPKELQEIVYYDNGGVQLRVQEGSRLGDLYAYDYQRAPDGQVLIGSNGFPNVDFSKTVLAGNALPDWLGGLTNTFSYKNMSFSFLLEQRHGGDVADNSENNSVRNGITALTGQRYERVVFDGVVKVADGSFSPNTNLVFLDDNFYRSSAQFYRYKGYTVQDGSWLRLRNVNFNYSLPKELAAKTPFKGGIRFSLTANNLWVNTPFRGYDPESLSFGSGSNIIGFVGNTTPMTKSYQFGVNITL
jgi:TonB-linked SusC/RagA family outer membrane protein